MNIAPRLIALLALATALVAQAAPPLLSPAELQARLAQPELRVIDIRSPKVFDHKHIPGALSAPYGSWRGPAGNPGELPELPRLTRLVQSLGLTPASHVVVAYSGDDAADFGAAARVYWTLKVLGFNSLSVLNGGMQAWAAAGLAQDSLPQAVPPSRYVPVLDHSLIATREALQARLASGGVRLFDARPAAFFTGATRHPASLVPGTLKGALNLEYTRWFAPDSASMLPPDELKQRAAAFAGSDGVDTVSFCNTGHWAAINWFVLSEVAGHGGVRLYPGSMVEWSQAPGAPAAMDNVPGRAGQLLVDFRLWVDRTFN
ncbi:MAG: sulfurtransferase [Leptothrix sp. (in: Bacteria)]|nr:sulfurtransferase [Leptothrix sp. (in: b-proteobacteria)]